MRCWTLGIMALALVGVTFLAWGAETAQVTPSTPSAPGGTMVPAVTATPATTVTPSTAPATLEKIELPKPLETSGVDLLAALKGRHSTRSFDVTKPIPDDVLATILWAADGVNRSDGKHTSPSAMNLRYMHIFVFRPDGSFRYDQDNHVLLRLTKEDLRPAISRQSFMITAPVVLILSADLSVLGGRDGRNDPALRKNWAEATAGCLGQNVYLAAEAFGIGTVFAAGLNEAGVRKGLSLKADETPLYIMPLGYPKAK
jgi:nitroreductase